MVITRAKLLSRLVFEITQTSPKRYSFSLVSRLQNTALDIVSCMYKANDTLIKLKLIDDMDKTISFMENKKSGGGYPLSAEEERRLFQLKISRGLKYSERVTRRLEYSLEAMTALKRLDWLSVLARDMGCITQGQLERLSSEIFEVRRLLTGYIKSDRKRYGC